MSRILIAAASLAAAMALGPLAVLAQVPPELASAEALAVRVEMAERDPAMEMDLDMEPDLAAVDRELARVTAYLQSHPGDPTALLLSVRLGRIRDLLAFRDAFMAMWENPQAGEPTVPSYSGYMRVLNGILEGDESAAAVHYWKARLLLEDAARNKGLGPGGAVLPALADPVWAEAMHHAKLAVANAPENVVHREFLAHLLAAGANAAEAAEVLAHPSTAGRLMQLLVQDLLAFAPPPPAERDQVLAAFMEMVTMMGAGDIGDPALARYLELRSAGWSTSAGMTEVEAYYTGLWPDLRFFSAEGWEGASAAVFIIEDGEWRPVSTQEEYDEVDQGGVENLTLLLIPPEVRAELGRVSLRQGMPPEAVLPGQRVGILLGNSRRGPAARTAGR